MLGRPRLVTAAGAPMTPERERLAVAIAEHREVVEMQESSAKALATAKTTARRALGAVEAAETELETAKAAAAVHLTQVARGTAGEAPKTIREARTELEDATDQLEAANAAVIALEAQIAEAEGANRLLVKAMRLREAALAVVASEAADRARVLAEDAVRLYEAFLRTDAALSWLLGTAKVQAAAKPSGFDRQTLSNNLPNAVRAAWEARLSAIMADATAHFPTDL